MNPINNSMKKIPEGLKHDGWKTTFEDGAYVLTPHNNNIRNLNFDLAKCSRITTPVRVIKQKFLTVSTTEGAGRLPFELIIEFTGNVSQHVSAAPLNKFKAIAFKHCGHKPTLDLKSDFGTWSGQESRFVERDGVLEVTHGNESSVIGQKVGCPIRVDGGKNLTINRLLEESSIRITGQLECGQIQGSNIECGILAFSGEMRDSTVKANSVQSPNGSFFRSDVTANKELTALSIEDCSSIQAHHISTPKMRGCQKVTFDELECDEVETVESLEGRLLHPLTEETVVSIQAETCEVADIQKIGKLSASTIRSKSVEASKIFTTSLITNHIQTTSASPLEATEEDGMELPLCKVTLNSGKVGKSPKTEVTWKASNKIEDEKPLKEETEPAQEESPSFHFENLKSLTSSLTSKDLPEKMKALTLYCDGVDSKVEELATLHPINIRGNLIVDDLNISTATIEAESTMTVYGKVVNPRTKITGQGNLKLVGSQKIHQVGEPDCPLQLSVKNQGKSVQVSGWIKNVSGHGRIKPLEDSLHVFSLGKEVDKLKFYNIDISLFDLENLDDLSRLGMVEPEPYSYRKLTEEMTKNDYTPTDIVQELTDLKASLSKFHLKGLQNTKLQIEIGDAYRRRAKENNDSFELVVRTVMKGAGNYLQDPKRIAGFLFATWILASCFTFQADTLSFDVIPRLLENIVGLFDMFGAIKFTSPEGDYVAFNETKWDGLQVFYQVCYKGSFALLLASLYNYVKQMKD